MKKKSPTFFPRRSVNNFIITFFFFFPRSKFSRKAHPCHTSLSSSNCSFSLAKLTKLKKPKWLWKSETEVFQTKQHARVTINLGIFFLKRSISVAVWLIWHYRIALSQQPNTEWKYCKAILISSALWVIYVLSHWTPKEGRRPSEF